MSRFTDGWEALQARLTQSVETIHRNTRIQSHSSDIDEVDLAENVAEWYALYEDVPLVNASINSFASDVVEPGYRVEGEDEAAIDYLMETWLPQAAIIAGEKHKDFQPFLKQTVIERWARGGALIEHVRPEPTSEQISGVNFVLPETVEARTEANRNILVDPDADTNEQTARKEAAAYVQFDDNAILGPFDDRDEIRLSQNDVTRSVLNPKTGDLWGTPVTEVIKEDVRGFLQMLRDMEQAIQTKAYGIWSVAFGRDTIEGPDFFEIIEWSDDDQEEFIEEKLNSLGPGEIVGHDGEISLEKFDADVPDLIDHLEFYVNNITTALPTPKFVVGFEKDINQFVTDAQNERYQALINEEREAIERDITQFLKRVVEQNKDIEDADIQFKIEPEDDESPIRSLAEDDIQNILNYSKAVKNLTGTADPATLIPDDEVRDLILQLPELDPAEVEQELDEADPEVQEQFAQAMADD